MNMILWPSSDPSSECNYSRPCLNYGTAKKSLGTCPTMTYHKKNGTELAYLFGISYYINLKIHFVEKAHAFVRSKFHNLILK
jgi:hypothetical protein